MSRSPYFFVERYNFKTEKWELMHPYIKNSKGEFIPADLWYWNGSHDIFEIVEGKNYTEPMKGIHYGLPKRVSSFIQDAFNECSYTNDFNENNPIEVTPEARYFTYADMLIYLNEYPKVVNYNEEQYDENGNFKQVMVSNPLYSLKARVDVFLEVCSEYSYGYEDDYSYIRIVYWID